MASIDFYDKDIYKKRPTTKAEAEKQLVQLMDDLVVRETNSIKEMRKTTAVLLIGFVALLFGGLLIAHLVGVNGDTLSKVGLVLIPICTIVGVSLCSPVGNLKTNRRNYKRIKEKVLSGTFDKDVIDFTNRMIDAALEDKAKGR